MTCRAAAVILVTLVALFAPRVEAGSIVRFRTSLGKIDFVLQQSIAPGTTLNFQGYVLRGDYDSTIIHRSHRDFVIQGGGFGFETDYFQVPTLDPIATERRNRGRLSNERGTVAMALSTGPNSATSQWFVNLVDSTFLDEDFTVFARIAPADMGVVDAIADLTVESGDLTIDHPLAPVFAQLPVLEPLDSFAGECFEVLPEPTIDPGNGRPVANVIDTCGADDEARSRDKAARIVALSDTVPERLVRVEKAVLLPVAEGQLQTRLESRITLLDKRIREVYATGTEGPTELREFVKRRFPCPPRPGRAGCARVATTAAFPHQIQLRDLEWGVDISPTAWRATALPGVSYSGGLEPRGTTGRRFGLTLDEVTLADIIASARVDLEDRVFAETWTLEPSGLEFLVRPEDRDGDPFTGGLPFEYPPEDMFPFTSTVIMLQAGEPKVRAVVNRAGNRIAIRGRIPITGGTEVIAYHEVNGPVSPFRSDVVTPLAGEIRFKIKGPFRRFKDAPPAP